jgi:EAL domain-containing protein (putative c-di-GMP-specific phosphodiesterase class I)/GGDEF domain-containing protein
MVLAYAALAGLIIAVSDALILALASDSHRLEYFLAFKGVLVAVVTGAVLVSLVRRDNSRHEQSQRELYMARHDPSTKLLGRGEWIKRVDAMIVDPLTRHIPAVVLTVTIDRYDYLVHRFGSEAMHQWLGVFGRYLRMLAKSDDLVGCVSPAVFVLHVHGVDARREAMEIVERMLETGKRTFPIHGEAVTLNLNVGLCTHPEDGANAEDLLARANIAMRRAISEGPNRSCWYRPEIAEQVIGRARLEKDLQRALERRELQLYFQPRVCLVTGSICGCEALLRWRHPRRGMVPPAAFIGVAEESGLIVDIGRWVLAESVAFLRDWTDVGLPPMNVSVNVSNAQLAEGGFLHDLDEALGHDRLFAPFIELELTESLAMSDPHRTMEVLQQVKRSGMRVALDDFGTGYSSLSYLQRFPIDCLKVDSSFIRDLTGNRNSQELIKTVIALGHSLGAQVCAEGVETGAQARMLTDFGCDEGQGFFYGKPAPGERLIGLAQETSPTVRMGRVGPAYLPPVGAGGALIKETARVGT